LNDEDEEKELHELIKYIVQRVTEDKKGNYDPEDVATILRAEAAYVDILDLSF
jgi:hypothetical protein